MGAFKRVSEAEWIVMKIIWKEFPLTAADIIKHLDGKMAWHPKTVKTLLHRLAGKKVLGTEKQGREYLFRPLISEAQCVKTEAQSFMNRVFDGALHPMLVHFVKNERLSKEEIQELQKILREKKED